MPGEIALDLAGTNCLLLTQGELSSVHQQDLHSQRFYAPRENIVVANGKTI